MKLKSLLHVFKVKAETGLDKLISVETQIDVALHDNLEALKKQQDNAKQLFVSKREFETEFEKIQNNVNRYKTNCQVLKNRGLKKEDPEMRVALSQYVENKKVLDTLEVQKKEIDATAIKVEESLKKLNLNKSLLETKAAALKTKIKMYKIQETISDAGLIDIDNTYNDVNDMINKMQSEQEASEYVRNLVNGTESVSSNSMSDSEIDNIFESL